MPRTAPDPAPAAPEPKPRDRERGLSVRRLRDDLVVAALIAGLVVYVALDLAFPDRDP